MGVVSGEQAWGKELVSGVILKFGDELESTTA